MLVVDKPEVLFAGYIRDIIDFLPVAGTAIVVGVIGYLIARGLQKSIAKFFSEQRLEKYFEKMGWEELKKEAKIEKSVGELFGGLFYWTVLLITFVVVFNILGFEAFSQFLEKILLFIPNVIVAGFIFGITALFAGLTENIVRGALIKSKIAQADQIGLVSKWAVWLFGIFAALSQLKIAPEIVVSLFQGVLAFIVISLGLAFGLGGVETARKIWEDIYNQLKGKD